MNKTVLFHLTQVSIFFVIPVLVASRPPEEAFFTVTRPFIRDIAGNALILAFFYFNYFFLLPAWYQKKKLTGYWLMVLACFTAVILLPSLFTQRFSVLSAREAMPPPVHTGQAQHTLFSFLFDEVKHHIFIFLIALIFSLMLRVQEYNARLKEEKLKAELNSLNAQINPHFLFNTLNSIYALSVNNDERVSDAITHLAGLMRYVIKDAKNSLILLEKELEYIENYIELQKARLGHTADVVFECTGLVNHQQIAPLVLITFIENAFKYGVNPDFDHCRIEVKIHVEEHILILYVYNTKHGDATVADTTGIGVINTRERLHILYPQRYQLDIDNANTYYSVHLTIDML